MAAWIVLKGSAILAQNPTMSPQRKVEQYPFGTQRIGRSKDFLKMQTRNACGRNSHNDRVSSQELPEAWNPTDLAVLSDEDGFLHNMDILCGRGSTS